jgi:hypothetical protein
MQFATYRLRTRESSIWTDHRSVSTARRAPHRPALAEDVPLADRPTETTTLAIRGDRAHTGQLGRAHQGRPRSATRPTRGTRRIDTTSPSASSPSVAGRAPSLSQEARAMLRIHEALALTEGDRRAHDRRRRARCDALFGRMGNQPSTASPAGARYCAGDVAGEPRSCVRPVRSYERAGLSAGNEPLRGGCGARRGPRRISRTRDVQGPPCCRTVVCQLVQDI